MKERITISDIRKYHCCQGIYSWFLANGWTKVEFREFLDNGIEADELLARGDAMAERVVKLVRAGEQHDGRR